MADERTEFSTQLLEKISKFKEKERGCDVELISNDGTSFAAHRIILAACSDHLQTMLFKKDQKRKFILHDIDSVGLQAVVDYAYSGKLDLTSVTKNTVQKKILPAFVSFGIQDGRDLCKERLNVKEQTIKTEVRTPMKRKRDIIEEEVDAEVEDDLTYVDDEMDEDFIPPTKRHSPRRSVKTGKVTPKSEKVDIIGNTEESKNIDDFISKLDNGKYRCTKCDSEFPQIKGARQHVRHICGFTDKKYKCQICGKGFTVMRYVFDHERRTHQHYRNREDNTISDLDGVEKALECRLCGSQFESKGTISTHLSKLHRIDETTLSRIMEELGPEDVVVPRQKVPANKKPGGSTGVRQRKQPVRADQSNKDRRYACEFCEARFEIKRYLSDHNRRVHGVRANPNKDTEDIKPQITALGLSATENIQEDGTYLCPDCRFSFEASDKFDEHRGLDTENMLLICPCESCSETFNCMTLWEQHQLWRHDSSLKYQCVKCGLLFTRSIKEHVRECKLESDGHSCEKCEVNFKTLQLLRNHCCKNSAKPTLACMKPAMAHKHACGTCGRGFSRLADLIKHKYADKCKRRPKPIWQVPYKRKCKYKGCKRIFQHEKSFMKHKRMCVKADTIMCDICGQVVGTNRIHTHKRRHMEFKCDFCQKKFKTPRAYNTHKGCGSFQCDVCGHVSQCEGLHRAHLVFHGGARQFTCHCGLKFKTESSLKEHKQKCTAPKETKLYQCLECGVEFKSLLSLKSHSYIHTNPFKYQCPVCQRHFSTSSGYYAHKRNRHKDLTHECPTCKKNFLSLVKLNEHHDSVHKGITHKFDCNKCGMKFRGEYKYGQHMKEKHGEAVFKCPNCSQGFGYKSHLKDHLDRCLGRMKIVQCEICNKSMQRTTYREHMKVHLTPKRFVCPKCNRGFDHSWLVNNHACKVGGVYTCTICGQKQKTIHGSRIHMNQHVKNQTPKRQRLMKKEEAATALPDNTETRSIEAFMGPDGQIYLPEGTVLAEGEELILDTVQSEDKPIFVKSEYEEGEMQDEVELVQSIRDEGAGTELVLSGDQGDERYIVQVIDEEQQGGEAVTVDSDITEGAPPIEAQDVRYVHLPGGESVIQISIDGNTTLMLPCEKT